MASDSDASVPTVSEETHPGLVYGRWIIPLHAVALVVVQIQNMIPWGSELGLPVMLAVALSLLGQKSRAAESSLRYWFTLWTGIPESGEQLRTNWSVLGVALGSLAIAGLVVPLLLNGLGNEGV